MVMKMPLERHLLNLYGCNKELLAEVGPLKQRLDPLLKEVSQDSYFHQFQPEGVTGIYIWRGGELAIHTWPEHNAAAISLFSLENIELIKRLRILIPCYEPVLEQLPLGQEVAATLNAIDGTEISSSKDLLTILQEASDKAKYKVVGSVSLETNTSMSAALVLSESHFSSHYLPAERKLFVDIFTCGPEGNPETGLKELIRMLEPENYSVNFYLR